MGQVFLDFLTGLKMHGVELSLLRQLLDGPGRNPQNERVTCFV